MNTLFRFFGIESKQESGPWSMWHSCWGVPKRDAILCWRDAIRVLRGCCLTLEAPRDPDSVESERVEDSGIQTLDTGSDVVSVAGTSQSGFGNCVTPDNTISLGHLLGTITFLHPGLRLCPDMRSLFVGQSLRARFPSKDAF